MANVAILGAVVWLSLVWDSERGHHCSYGTDKHVFSILLPESAKSLSNTRYKLVRTPLNLKGERGRKCFCDVNIPKIERRGSPLVETWKLVLCLTEKGLPYLKIKKKVFSFKTFMVFKICGSLISMELIWGAWYELGKVIASLEMG